LAVKNNLRKILSDRGLKQTWLADKSGLDRSTLSSIVANKHSTSLEAAMKISKVLNLDIDEIFELEDDENID